MKTIRNIILATLLMGGLAFHAHGQTVTLGDATFDETSADAPADGFYPMVPLEKVQTCKGYGDYEEFMKTLQFNVGGTSAAGIECVTRTTIGSSLRADGGDLVEPNGERVSTQEVLCLALDTSGNVRVLKVTAGDAVVFEASESVTPPILMPANPTLGDTWEVMGKKITVVDANASAGGHEGLLKLKVEAAGAPVALVAEVAPVDPPLEPTEADDPAFEYEYYKAGEGLVVVESSLSDAEAGSGWIISE